MAIDHFGKTIIVGSVVEIRPVKFIKTGLGWYRKLAKMRKHCRRGTVTAIAANNDLTIASIPNSAELRLIPSRYVEKIS